MNIKLQNFSYEIPGSKKALFSIEHFTIASGEKILIRGPSGCGKSSFLHALAGLIPSAMGQVFYDSLSLLELSNPDKTRFRWDHLGLIFQKLSLLEHFSVLENLLLEQDNQKLAQEILDSFGLREKENILVRKLSLGEQQKLAVMRVLMKEFQVLMADEPTSSLDDDSALFVIKKLLGSCQNKTLLCVSHDHRIESHFDRIINLTAWRPDVRPL
jgi:putative ABC transport system ATP-binding protein